MILTGNTERRAYSDIWYLKRSAVFSFSLRQIVNTGKSPCLPQQSVQQGSTSYADAKENAIAAGEFLWNFFSGRHDIIRLKKMCFCATVHHFRGNQGYLDFAYCRAKRTLWIGVWWLHLAAQLKTSSGSNAQPTQSDYLQDLRVSCGDPGGSCVRMVSNDCHLRLFKELRKRCEEGQLNEALLAVDVLEQQGMQVSTTIFCCLVKLCIKKKDLAAGREVHFRIVRRGLASNAFLGSHLIRMYILCGSLLEANQVFNKLPTPNVFAWSSIMLFHTKLGHDEHAIELYYQMRETGGKPGSYTYVAVLKACSSLAALDQGRLIHGHIIETGCELDVFVSGTLVDMYAKSWSLDDACRVFNRSTKRDLVAWSAMIAGFAHHGHGLEALKLFQQLQLEGVELDSITVVSILKACSGLAALYQGRKIHASIAESEYAARVFVSNALIDMYVKCGSLENAHSVFNELQKRDIISWSALIDGYAQHGYGHEALQLFQKMQQEGMEPNEFTFVCTLKACSCIAALDQGRQIHAHITESVFDLSVFVGNLLIDMYAKFECFGDACKVFDKLPHRDVVTWSAMISGYTQHGHGYDALQFFLKMQEGGVEPNDVTFVAILKACSSIAALDQGKLIHAKIMGTNSTVSIFVGNVLIDMYAKCGSLEDASRLFVQSPNHTVVTWNSLIAGYAQYGNYKWALQLFKDMQKEHFRPDGVTFTSLLSACSHTGLLEQGWLHFRSIREDYDIRPTLDHYTCMVDLLGRAGHFGEIRDLLQSMPFQPDIVWWMSLLTHCRTHGNVELARWCFDCVVAIDCSYASGYILMSGIYADAGMYEVSEKIDFQRICAQAWKKPGKAFIEVDSEVHDFIVGDKLHPSNDAINVKLERLRMQIKEGGYIPLLDILQSISDED